MAPEQKSAALDDATLEAVNGAGPVSCPRTHWRVNEDRYRQSIEIGSDRGKIGHGLGFAIGAANGSIRASRMRFPEA